MARRAAALTQAKQKTIYLDVIGRIGTLTAACRAAGCSPHTVYKWREHDTTFTVRENEARNAFADQLEEEAVRRAYTGTLKPVYQGGKRVGDVREFDTTLLVMLLKAVRPDKYRERHDVTTGGRPLNAAHLDFDAEIERGLARLAARGEGAAALVARHGRPAQPTHAER